MIISHTHKYIFIQLPKTASSSIGKELIENYDGQKILDKHAHYHDFLKTANADEQEYFVFSCIRNPLDAFVSEYFKIKNQHGLLPGKQMQLVMRNKGLKGLIKGRNRLRGKINFLRNNEGFTAYFNQYCKFTYDNWSRLEHNNFDYVIRFENLQADFATVLELIGLEQKRPLPMTNKTPGKGDELSSYYVPEIQKKAKDIFGPFMDKWGYDFPTGWNEQPISWLRQLEFSVCSIPRSCYWKYWQKPVGYSLPRVFLYRGSRETKWSLQGSKLEHCKDTQKSV